MPTVTNAEEACGCGCACCAAEARPREQEIVELRQLINAASARLEQLEHGA
ncbi:MAG: hypothetical protein M3N32_01045 [Actinomycetota bacterium]|nr:hypothetical protein [Actinomycetota bacterium]